MLRETGVIAVTGIKRVVLLSMAVAAAITALCLFGILIWQVIGLLPALSYVSDTSAVPAEAWVQVAIKSAIALVCYFLGIFLFKKCGLWWAAATAPLAGDFQQSAELIANVGAAVSSNASEIRRSVDQAVGATHKMPAASRIPRQSISAHDKESEFLRKPCHICGSAEKTKVESLYYCTDCNVLLGKP